MTHMEGRAFLEEMQASAKRYLNMLEDCIGQAEDLDTEGSACVTETGQRSLKLLAEQLQSWQQFLRVDEVQCEPVNLAGQAESSSSHQTSGCTQDKISRVTAMGGTPALGAGMVLPKLHQRQLLSLSNTESAAAREVHAAQGKGHVMSLQQPSVTTPSNSPPWLVELRKRQGSSQPSSPPSE